jgi:hypothetical protein
MHKQELQLVIAIDIPTTWARRRPGFADSGFVRLENTSTPRVRAAHRNRPDSGEDFPWNDDLVV